MSRLIGCARADLIRLGWSNQMIEIWQRLCLLVDPDDLTQLSDETGLLDLPVMTSAPEGGPPPDELPAMVASLRAEIAAMAGAMALADKDAEIARLRAKCDDLEGMICLCAL